MANKGDIFWSRFVHDKSKYERFSSLDADTQEHLLDELLFTLHDYSEGLFFEISDQKPFELIITAQGIADYFGQAEYLVKQAPPIDDWKIIALKPAIGSGYTFEINGTRVSEEDSRFIPITEEDSPDAIAIQIIHPAMPAEGINDQLRTDLIMGIYSNLDSLLGERSVTLDVERLEFSSEISPEDKALPLSELISYINWKKKERSNYGVRFPEQTYAAYEGEVDGFVKMLMAVVSLNYYSYKPDYPYLNIVELAFNEIDESGFPVEDISEIQDVEAFISDRIRSTELGHHCLSDTGNGKREMWFYLKDDVSIDEILTQLREEMQSHLISYTTMYDPYWVKANEFIK